ncbi:MAG: hypothetical protein ACKV2U_30585 [Bryobacteraceae bacterium]
MRVQSVSYTPVVPRLQAPIAEALSKNFQSIAWTPDRAASVRTPVAGELVLTGLVLHTAPLPDAGTNKAQAKVIKSAASLLCNEIGKLDPAMGKVCSGLKVIIASKDAMDSWTEPGRTSAMVPSLKTAKALLSLVEVLSDYVPAIKPHAGTIQIISILVGVGDTANEVRLAVEG